MPGPQDTGGQPYIDAVAQNAVVVNLTQTGIHNANASPVTANTTSAYTGVAAQTTSALACTTSTTLASDPGLAVTVNEPGVYSLSVETAFYAAANGAAGVKFDLAGGTANVSTINWGWIGCNSTAAMVTALANTQTTGAQTISSVSGSGAGAPSWLEIEGTLTIKTPGTFSVRWAQATSNSNSIYRSANSYLELLKIG